ncbi:hypothetical protein KC367_g70 [Hortaea werneckii]|nr:hypothetical protein KC367_g70 [Hortaea werneckii]
MSGNEPLREVATCNGVGLDIEADFFPCFPNGRGLVVCIFGITFATWQGYMRSPAVPFTGSSFDEEDLGVAVLDPLASGSKKA